MSTRPAVRSLLSLAVFAALLTACGSSTGSCPPEDTACTPGHVVITVNVVGEGTGGGQVLGFRASSNLHCTLPQDPVHPSDCDDQVFSDGTPDYYQLDAYADVGSVFAGWSSGCSRIKSGSRESCFIDFSGLTSFTATVTARFDVSSGQTNTMSVYNGTDRTVTIVVGSQPAVPNVAPGGSPQFQIPTAIGTMVVVRAQVGVDLPTITCTVTAAAWQGPDDPIVLLSGPPPYSFNCNGF